jgi:hypothetical protein
MDIHEMKKHRPTPMPKSAYRLLTKLDSDGEGLTAAEIYWVASLLDGEQEQFTGSDAKKLKKLYRKRVDNPESSDD